MKRILALTMTVLALCCLAQQSQAKRWWGTPPASLTTPSGGTWFHPVDSILAATTIVDLNQNGSPNNSLRYASPANGTTSWNHPIVGDTLTFTGKIITAYDTKPTTYGFWIEEPAGGAWSGVLVYTGGDNIKTIYPTTTLGDIVTVSGIYAEFGTLPRSVTELNTAAALGSGTLMPMTKAVTITGHTGVPTAVRIHPGQLGQGGIPGSPPADYGDTLCAEMWQGVLVRMDSVFIQKKYNTLGNGTTVIAEANLQDITPIASLCRPANQDTCRIGPKMIDPSDTTTWTLGAQIRTVFGIASQEFDTYKLWPRNLADITYLGAPPPPDVVRAHATDGTHVKVYFDSKMDDTTTVAGNYALDNGVNVTAAALGPDSTTVTLTTTAMTGGTAMTLLVAGGSGGVRTAGFPHTNMAGDESRKFRGGITTIQFAQTPGVGRGDTTQIFSEIVTVQGVVTADLGSGEVYIGDPAGGNYSGLEIFGAPNPVAVGDNVTYAGLITEFTPSGSAYSKTEIGPVYYMSINSHGNALPTPANVTIAQIKNGAATANLYDDMLVRVQGFAYQDTCAPGNKDWLLSSVAFPGAGDQIGVGQQATYNYVPCPNDQVDMIAIDDVNGTSTTIPSGRRLQPRQTSDMYAGGSGGVGGSGNVSFALRQSAPNPFSSRTEIRYSIARTAPATLNIYNVSGQVVRTLAAGVHKAGEYSVTWDGKNQNGRSVSSGIYYYRLSSENQSLTRKLVLSH